MGMYTAFGMTGISPAGTVLAITRREGPKAEMASISGSTNVSGLLLGALDRDSGPGVWRNAASLLGWSLALIARLLDRLARWSEPYDAEAARVALLLERMPPELRVDAALSWASRNGRIV